MKTKIQILNRIEETTDAFTLVLEDLPALRKYKAGQFINVYQTIKSNTYSRPYSFSSSPFLGEPPTLTIKRVKGGWLSNYLGDHANTGSELLVGGPLGKFTTTYNAERSRNILMIGGGSGITPLFSILKLLLKRETKTQVTLFYANSNSESIIFKKQLDLLSIHFSDRFRLVHFLERERGKSSVSSVIREGRVTKADFNTFLTEHKLTKKQLDVFVCGPTGLQDFTVNCLLELGVHKTQLKIEQFHTEPTSSLDVNEQEGGQVSNVQLTNYKGTTVTMKVPYNSTVLQEAFSQNVTLPHGCKQAMCGTCKVKLVEGTLTMKNNFALTVEDLQSGYVLLCSGYPKTAKVVVSYD